MDLEVKLQILREFGQIQRQEMVGDKCHPWSGGYCGGPKIEPIRQLARLILDSGESLLFGISRLELGRQSNSVQ